MLTDTCYSIKSCSDCRRSTCHMAPRSLRTNDDEDDYGRLTSTVSQLRHRRRRATAAVPSTPVVIATTLAVCLLTPATATTCDIEVGTGEDDDWRPPSTVEMILRAQSVIYGHVVETYPDSAFDFGRGTQVYTAEIEVFCTLKGRRLDPVVNVSRAGLCNMS